MWAKPKYLYWLNLANVSDSACELIIFNLNVQLNVFVLISKKSLNPPKFMKEFI